MKNIVKQSLFSLLCLSFLLIFSACQKDNNEVAEVTPVDPEGTALHANHDHPAFEYQDEIINHVDDHGLNLDVTEKIDFLYPDGTSEEKLLVDGCIAMSEEELRDIMAQINSGDRQYRTFNLVNPQTINVVGYTGGSFALTSKMRTALSWAINNYNALNINLNFTLSFTTNLNNADIVVYRNANNNNAGGVAGFPSGGQPYRWVQIYNGMENYNTNVNEHVMTHEIGHCLGLRHTDYFSRASCGQNSNEGSAGVGAVHIPGTPTGIDWNSVMLACFSNNEDGEFGPFDRVALEYLY